MNEKPQISQITRIIPIYLCHLRLVFTGGQNET
jgi:hypothetical protein